MTSSEDDSLSFSSDEDFTDPKLSLPPIIRRKYIEHMYSHLASLDCVKAIARKRRDAVRLVGDKKALGKHMRHGNNSLDTIIYKALKFVRNINPLWDLEFIRLETNSKQPELIVPRLEYHRKLGKTHEWNRRFKSCEFILIPHTKFTTYILMDDSYKDYPEDEYINPCGPVTGKAHLEEPIRPEQFQKWVADNMKYKPKRRMKYESDEVETEDEEEDEI